MSKVFYFHVPKTAGSSLTNLLDRHFENTCHHIEGSEGINNKNLSQFDLVSGHLSYSRMQHVLNLNEWTTLATFREPYSHLVSHISWVRKLADEGQEERFNQHPKQFQDLSLKMKSLDFSEVKDIKMLIKHFVDIDYFYFHNTQTLYMDNQRRYEVAKNNLNTINLVGVMESMDDFFRKLQQFFNWNESEQYTERLNSNSNKYGFDLTDQRTRNVLYPMVNKDLLLYDEAARLAENEA